MTAALSQIELISAIGSHLDKNGFKELAPRQFEAVIAAANIVIDAMRQTPVMAYANMGLAKWLASDDTGMSSKFMAAVLGGIGGKYAHPWDADDFGRCVRLLDAVPEFRERIAIMRSESACDGLHGLSWSRCQGARWVCGLRWQYCGDLNNHCDLVRRRGIQPLDSIRVTAAT